MGVLFWLWLYAMMVKRGEISKEEYKNMFGFDYREEDWKDIEVKNN